MPFARADQPAWIHRLWPRRSHVAPGYLLVIARCRGNRDVFGGAGPELPDPNSRRNPPAIEGAVRLETPDWRSE
jgi:hypothetical protein